jgi:hypothetical protein
MHAQYRPSIRACIALTVAIASALIWLPVRAQERPPAEPAEVPKAEKSGPHPQAVVAQPVVDLGEVTYGDSRTLEFAIKNTGDDVLRIHAAKSQCACAVIEFPPEVAPGAEGKVAVRFDAALSGGPSAVPIEVVSNDPDSPTLQLTIKADIRYFIEAQPGYVRYVVVQDFEADSTVKQMIWAVDGSPMRITKVDSPYDFVETSFREARPDELPVDAAGKQQWRLETRISPKAPIGPLKGFLTIHVDHPKQKIVKLPINGFVRPMFAVTPPAADWGDLTISEKGARASLLVKNFAKEEVAVTGAESSVAGITTAIEEVEAGRQYFVVLNYAPDMAKGKFSGVLRIKTESPKQPVIEVPLRGTIL